MPTKLKSNSMGFNVQAIAESMGQDAVDITCLCALGPEEAGRDGRRARRSEE